MTRNPRWVLLFAAVTVAAAPARAQDAARILERVDSALAAPRDLVATQRMTLIDPDGREKVRTLRMYQKGLDLRMAKFVEPAEVRDVGFLRLAADQMYLYLPAFRRVRRIASSIKNQDFMGTDLSYEDLSRIRFADDYQAIEAAREESGYQVILRARPGADVSNDRIVMGVDGATWIVTRLDLFRADNVLVKTIIASDIGRTGDYSFARHIEVETARDGHRTVLELQDVQVDTGLTDDFFSQRQLKRRG